MLRPVALPKELTRGRLYLCSMLTVKEAEEWLNRGGEKQVIFHLTQHLSAMARMHEFMIKNSWDMETPESAIAKNLDSVCES